jgi:hypothetical protein
MTYQCDGSKGTTLALASWSTRKLIRSAVDRPAAPFPKMRMPILYSAESFNP